MLRPSLKLEARSMWPYVTPQAQKIRHTAPAICVKHPSLARAYVSITQPRKQVQAISAVSTDTLTYENASDENPISNIDIGGSQLQKNAQGESRIAGNPPAMVGVVPQWLPAGKQHAETNSQEQDDSLATASIELPPAPKPFGKDLYWQKISLWQDVSEEKFQEYKWQVSHHTLTMRLLRAAPSSQAPADEIPRLQMSSETRQSCISFWSRRCQRR
jgi:hypothetical protein